MLHLLKNLTRGSRSKLSQNRHSQNRQRRIQRSRRELVVETLERRELLAAGDLRIVSYNILAFDGTPSPDLGIVLEAIGREEVAGRARPIDILAIQESQSQNTSTQNVVDQLNAIYGGGTYARGSVNGSAKSQNQTVGLVYNTQTVQLISEIAVAAPAALDTTRQAIRYQLRAIQAPAGNDFYLYNAHLRAGTDDGGGTTLSDAQRRELEAEAIRADADALGEGALIVYAGDFNTKSGFEAAFQEFLSAGPGRARDPINQVGAWFNNSAYAGIFTQAPTNNPPPGFAGGGLDDRFDFVITTDEFFDSVGFEYAEGSYRTFGNNGSVRVNGSINDASNTALANFADREEILDLLTTVTDHLPVVADFYFASSQPTGITLSNNRLAENRLFHSVVGQLQATSDNPFESYTYDFVSGSGDSDNLLFRITDNQLRTAAVFDYETKSQYTVRVRASNRAGQFAEQSFAIVVQDANEPPIVTVADSFFANTGVPFALAASATDPDSSQTLTFEWDLDFDGQSFVPDRIGESPVVSFDTTGVRSIAVRVTDNGSPALSTIEASSIIVTGASGAASRGGFVAAMTISDDFCVPIDHSKANALASAFPAVFAAEPAFLGPVEPVPDVPDPDLDAAELIFTSSRPSVVASRFGIPFSNGDVTPVSSLYHPLATSDFFQDWTDSSQITAADDWDAVPSIIGYRGERTGSTTGVDPQTILDDLFGPISVLPDRTNPNTESAGGVAEFRITDPVVALQGSGTADAPFLLLHINATQRESVRISYRLRDIDGSADNSIQPVALQYRIGESGEFTNLPAGFVADASSGPSLATLETPVAVTLPSIVDGQSQIQLRIMTTNAVGNDEWIGIDDIRVTSDPIIPPSSFAIAADAQTIQINELLVGETIRRFNVTRTGDTSTPASVGWELVESGLFPADAIDFVGALSGMLQFPIGVAEVPLEVRVKGDGNIEADEAFGVRLLNPSRGATIETAIADNIIVNDDYQNLRPGDVIITHIRTLPNPDAFAFVPLVDIKPGTTLRFTDNGWNGAANPARLGDAEGTISFVVPPAGLAKGTKVVVDQFGNVSPASAGTAFVTGSRLVNPGSFALNSTGDSLIVFIGNESVPSTVRTIFAVNTRANYLTSGSMTNSFTYLPAGLLSGETAVEPLGLLVSANGTVGEGQYNHSTTTGTRSAILASVTKNAQWSVDNDSVANPINSSNLNLTDAMGEIVLQHAGDQVEVREGGSSSSYTVGLSIPPSQPVEWVIAGDANALVSLNNVDFAFSVSVTLTSTASQTIYVKAVDDDLKEGDHLAIITHFVRASTAIEYPESMVGQALAAKVLDNDQRLASIEARHLFYNQSRYDGNDAAANGNDDNAIAPDKTPLLPGDGTATFQNYSNYNRGINGIMIDIENLGDVDALSLDDFQFFVGNSQSISSWAAAPAPNRMTVRPGAGVGGSDRITITWPSNAIQKQWLQVRMLANDTTGLEEPDVHFWGNAIGESGTVAGNTTVNATDELDARNNPRPSFVNAAAIDNPFDYDRDQRVNATDQLIARNNRTNFATRLILLSV